MKNNESARHVSKHRVLMLRSSEFYGGPERQIHQHALASQDSDFTVVVGAFSVAGRKPELLRITARDGIESKLFRTRNNYDPTVISQIRRFLIEANIDILATHDYRASLIGYLAVKRTNCHWLAWSRGWTHEGLKVAFFQLLEKIFVRFAERVLVVAKAQREKLLRWYVPISKLVVIHNAINIGRIEKAEPGDLRARFSLPGESIIIVSAGRFSMEKGQHILLHAVDIVVSKVPHAYFVLFGDGPRLGQCRSMVKNLKAKNQVFLPGFEENINEQLRSADLVVNPSLTEGLPNILLEAMALKVPIVATAVGGVPELIRNNVNGRLVGAGDPQKLASAIVELSKSEVLRAKFSTAGYQTVLDHFSIKAQTSKLHRVYAEILE